MHSHITISVCTTAPHGTMLVAQTGRGCQFWWTPGWGPTETPAALLSTPPAQMPHPHSRSTTSTHQQSAAAARQTQLPAVRCSGGLTAAADPVKPVLQADSWRRCCRGVNGSRGLSVLRNIYVGVWAGSEACWCLQQGQQPICDSLSRVQHEGGNSCDMLNSCLLTLRSAGPAISSTTTLSMVTNIQLASS
jgi:hypothetical protein